MHKISWMITSVSKFDDGQLKSVKSRILIVGNKFLASNSMVRVVLLVADETGGISKEWYNKNVPGECELFNFWRAADGPSVPVHHG